MLAFIHIPKTGGQSITKSMLRSSFGIRHCDVLPWFGENDITPFNASDLAMITKIYPFLQSIAGHSVMLHVNLDIVVSNIQYLAFVREPVSQYISHYNYRRTHKEPGISFRQWLDREEFHNHQTKMLAGCEDTNLAIQLIDDKQAFIGLTEHFDDSLVLFKQLFARGLDIAIQRRNEASNKNYAVDILSSPRNIEMIVERCKSDIQLYDYIKENLYPSYCKEYGNRLKQDVLAFQQTKGQVNHLNILLNRAYRNIVYKPIRHIVRSRRLESLGNSAKREGTA